MVYNGDATNPLTPPRGAMTAFLLQYLPIVIFLGIAADA